jgi:hypothetical protein
VHGITFGESGVGDVNRDTTPRIDEVVLDAIQGRQSNHGLTIWQCKRNRSALHIKGIYSS